MVERIVESVDRLKEFPRSGRVVPEVDRDACREVILGTYRPAPPESWGNGRTLRIAVQLNCGFRPAPAACGFMAIEPASHCAVSRLADAVVVADWAARRSA